MHLTLCRAGVLSAALAVASTAAAEENVMVVFDGSNSMWGQIDGVAKIEIARGVMKNLLGDWTDDRNVGLMAYGHRQRGDCSDIEILVQPGQQARQDILDRINQITPTGKTPLTTAVERAAEQLSYTDQPATVVLISDGLESCDRDPCALAEALGKAGVGFTAHVVGFGLSKDEDEATLACIAEKTGGEYISASNAEELGRALRSVATAVAEIPPEPEPVPEPEPEAPKVTVSGPETAVGGSDITVSWAPTIDQADYITVVPVGTDPGVFGQYSRIAKADKVVLTVPGDEGLYEIRYMNNSTRDTLGHATIEITKPEATLTAPDSVQTGAPFGVAWTPTINSRDYVTIVPANADQGVLGNYRAVRGDIEATLRAPADPGLYELRYVLNVDRRTVATRQIEVTDPQVVLQVPGSALTGAAFDVSWTGTVNAQDFITIVPVGTEEGKHGNYFSVRDDARNTLVAPADTGMYEVRYVLREGRKTLANEMIEIMAPEVTISGPETAPTGSRFKVSWTGTVHGNDYLTIVPAGAAEGEHGSYKNVRDATSGELGAPADPGLYELRYVLREGRKTLATAMIEIKAPEVTISAPAEIRAGDKLRVTWTGTVHGSDYVTLVPMGTPEDKLGQYIQVRDQAENEIAAPAETGMYEVRYVLREGSRVLARQPVEVLAADAALDAGASLTAPETAAPGSTIEVDWSVESESADQRITLARGNQAIFTWITAQKITGEPPVEIALPDETGVYELRFLDVANQAVLARKVIKLE